MLRARLLNWASERTEERLALAPRLDAGSLRTPRATSNSTPAAMSRFSASTLWASGAAFAVFPAASIQVFATRRSSGLRSFATSSAATCASNFASCSARRRWTPCCFHKLLAATGLASPSACALSCSSCGRPSARLTATAGPCLAPGGPSRGPYDRGILCRLPESRRAPVLGSPDRLAGRDAWSREFTREQLAAARQVDERLPERPAGPALASGERSSGADHGVDASVESALVGAPVAVESLLVLDRRSHSRNAEILRPESGHEMGTNVAGTTGIANTGSSPKPAISSGFL